MVLAFLVPQQPPPVLLKEAIFFLNSLSIPNKFFRMDDQNARSSEVFFSSDRSHVSLRQLPQFFPKSTNEAGYPSLSTRHITQKQVF
jgi:hypothetical protein